MRKILCISGTSRPNNYTAHALAVVVDELKKGEGGVEVEVVDAREVRLAFPGEPPTEDAGRLVASVKDAAGVVFATPEYHGSFAAMTKLIIENMGFPSALSGKAVGLVGVAAGRIGAVKSLEHLRAVCAHTGAVVMPMTLSIASVRNAFDESGTPTDPGSEGALRTFSGSFLEFIGNYVCPRMVLEEMTRQGDGKPWTASV